jgi:hypothetical protein
LPWGGLAYEGLYGPMGQAPQDLTVYSPIA